MEALVLERKDELTLRDIEIRRDSSGRTTCASPSTRSASAAATCTTTPTAPSARSSCARRWCSATRPRDASSRSAARSRTSRSATASAWSRASPTPTARPRGWACTTSTRPCASGRRRPSTASCARRSSTRPPSPSSCPTTSALPKAPWWSRWPSACTPPPRPRSSRATSPSSCGAGPIGMVTALAALAGGCSQVIMTDVQQPKLDLAATLGPITPVNVAKQNLRAVVDKLTDGWGVNIVFECSGNEKAAAGVFAPALPRRHGRLRRHPAAADRLRRGRRHGQGSARRARLPLCPRLPARHCADGQRQARRQAADHRQVHL